MSSDLQISSSMHADTECEQHNSPTSPLLRLPTELLQEIAFLSFNPNLYLTSKTIRFHLNTSRDYLQDLALLIFANRTILSSAWYHTKTLPWTTSQAKRWNLDVGPGRGKSGQIDRSGIQRQVLSLDFITAPRLSNMIRFVLRAWIDTHAAFTRNLPPEHAARLESYLTTTETLYLNYTVEDNAGNRLVFGNNSFVNVSGDLYTNMPANIRTRFIIDVQWPPTRLLQSDKGSPGEELGRLLLHRTYMDSLNHSIVKKYLATAKPKWMYTKGEFGSFWQHSEENIKG